MHLVLIISGIVVASLGGMFFSCLTYSLRDFSRSRLEEALRDRGRGHWLQPTIDHEADLNFVTAVARLLMNICILIAVMAALQRVGLRQLAQYPLALLITLAICLFTSVAIPQVVARHAGERFIAAFIGPLHALRVALAPLTKLLHAIDSLARRLAGSNGETDSQQIEQDILSAVEEGEKEGVVDEQEREMIEGVIELRDRQVGQIMIARPDVVALEIGSDLPTVKQTIEQTGHSRLPVYEQTLDKVVGVLYARDLLKFVGQPPELFNIRDAMRPPFYVPETKPLRDLLQDFRLQKVHMAIVLDEYGGTAGLVTIEDVLEQLVGEISDEHEPAEPAMFKRIDDSTAEADARLKIDELNRVLGLNLPEDAGYETLGGYVSTVLGRIPPTGTLFEQAGVRYTVLSAEPQRVNRVKIELLPKPVQTS